MLSTPQVSNKTHKNQKQASELTVLCETTEPQVIEDARKILKLNSSRCKFNNRLVATRYNLKAIKQEGLFSGTCVVLGDVIAGCGKAVLL